MSIYIQLVLITLVLGAIMPQKGKQRIYYIVIMTAIFLLSPTPKEAKPEAFHRSRRTWPKSTDMELPP